MIDPQDIITIIGGLGWLVSLLVNQQIAKTRSAQ